MTVVSDWAAPYISASIEYELFAMQYATEQFPSRELERRARRT
jgi:hypothetical protein